MDCNAPSESHVFTNSQELRFFAEALIKSMKEGHIRVECDPGYPFEPVRLLHLADRMDEEERRRGQGVVEKISGLTSDSLAYEVFLYAESLFCSILENDWYEGNYKGQDVESYDHAELRLRTVLEWIRIKDPTFDFEFRTCDIVVHEYLGTQYTKLDHDTLNAARDLQEWMPEEDRKAKMKEWWDTRVRWSIEDEGKTK